MHIQLSGTDEAVIQAARVELSALLGEYRMEETLTVSPPVAQKPGGAVKGDPVTIFTVLLAAVGAGGALTGRHEQGGFPHAPGPRIGDAGGPEGVGHLGRNAGRPPKRVPLRVGTAGGADAGRVLGSIVQATGRCRPSYRQRRPRRRKINLERQRGLLPQFFDLCHWPRRKERKNERQEENVSHG